MKHTPLTLDCTGSVLQGPDDAVGHVFGEEEAQFIVKACNNHEALVEALDKATELLEDANQIIKEQTGVFIYTIDPVPQFKALLNKIREE